MLWLGIASLVVTLLRMRAERQAAELHVFGAIVIAAIIAMCVVACVWILRRR